MKFNQFGTLVVIGVVVSVISACGGSPLKPTAVNPAVSDGVVAAAVSARQVTAEQSCVAQARGFDSDEGQTEETPGAETPDVEPQTSSCDSSEAGDQPQDGTVANEGSSMDSLRGGYRLHR